MIFPILEQKKIFLKNPALLCTTLYGFLAPSQNLEKTKDTIPRKHLDSRKDRRTDIQTLFIGHFQLLPGVQLCLKNIQLFRTSSVAPLKCQKYCSKVLLTWF